MFFVSAGIAVGVVYNKYKLDVDALTTLNNGVKVYSLNGEQTSLCNTNRSIVEIESLPKYVLNAFIDTEDKRFYSHSGFDILRIVKASFVNIKNGSKSQGASTISQQLIKNALLTNEKTYSRKIKELVLAHKMEKMFNKDEILEMYLNTIYFGSNAYGIENASQIYFNKSAKDLTLNETCALAGIIKSPAKYSPRTNIENCIERKNLVAKFMLDAGDITENEYNEVINSDIVVVDNSEFDFSYEEEAIIEACRLLNLTERELINKEYEIITFKDNELQKQVIEANNSVISASKSATNSNLDSVTILTNLDGHIQAYYVNSLYNLHNMKRQPASTLKPLAVYLPCIIHNILTPATQILDEPIDYNGYSPNNADNKFRGYVSTREAVSTSLNIPAVKALDYVGTLKAKETLSNLGINIDDSDLNLSLALGSTKNGVSLIDLLTAYVTIANYGTYRPLSFVSKILDKDKNVIYSHEDYSNKVFSDEDCFLLTDMLKDTAKTGSAKRLNSLNMPIASKTGTASNGEKNTDLYNVSYTTEHALISWISNIKDNSLPKNLRSSVEATEINKQILSSIYELNKPKDFVIPENVKLMPYDRVEAENNHRIVSPSSNLERYITYDYFKLANPPKENNINNNIGLTSELSKSGAKISFTALKTKEYTVIKRTDKDEILSQIKDVSKVIELTDKDVFNFEEITYIVKSDDLYEEITIRPKDYLINLLNNEILNGKRKWYV